MGNRIFPLNTSWQEGLTISHQYIRRAVIYLSFWPCHRKPDRQKTYLPPHITPIKTVLPNWHWWLSLLLGEAAVYFKLQVSDSQTFLFKDKGERCFAVTCHLGKQTKEYKFKSWMPVVEELQELHTESFQECGIKSMVGLGQCFVRCQFLITVTGINTPTVTGEWKQEVWVQSWIPGILVELQKSSCEDLPSLSSQWYKSCNKMIHPDMRGHSCIPAFLFVVSHCPVQMTTSSLKQ